MGLLITAPGARLIGEQAWLIEMPPHQVRLFGEARSSQGSRSVLLVKAARFDGVAQTLQFDADNAVALNIGTLPYALAIDSSWSPVDLSPDTRFQTNGATPLVYGPGDNEFLRLVTELPPDICQAATMLLEGVRRQSPGDLKRGLQRNFSNKPDNFWYVIVQPRVGELSVTIRGEPSRFPSGKLALKDDRPGYTRFKVTSTQDVSEALSLIFASRRKA